MSHGPPDLPIHLVPPLGGLLSTRGGHGKELQPCFTIREDFTDRSTGSGKPVALPSSVLDVTSWIKGSPDLSIWRKWVCTHCLMWMDVP